MELAANSKVITVCTFFVAVMMTLLYPVINYVMVNVVESMFELKKSSINNIMKKTVAIKNINNSPQNSGIDEFQTPWSTFNDYKVDLIHTDTEANSNSDNDGDDAGVLVDDYKSNTAAAVENIKVKVGSNEDIDAVSVRSVTVQTQVLKVVNCYKRHMVSLVGIFLTIVINAFVPQTLWSQVYSVLLTVALLFICYLMPCIMYLKLEPDWRHPKSIGALVIVGVNVVLMIGGITVIMMDSANQV